MLLDTHVWFWYLTGSARLPAELVSAIAEARGDCWLSPVSVWELGKLIERGRVTISTDYRSWVVQARDRFRVREAALNSEVALESLELDLPTRDPADRFLAATALVFELELVTLDGALLKAAAIPTRAF